MHCVCLASPSEQSRSTYGILPFVQFYVLLHHLSNVGGLLHPTPVGRKCTSSLYKLTVVVSIFTVIKIWRCFLKSNNSTRVAVGCQVWMQICKHSKAKLTKAETWKQQVCGLETIPSLQKKTQACKFTMFFFFKPAITSSVYNKLDNQLTQ